MNHMEERFTKLILFAAGDDMPNPGALNGKIDVTVRNGNGTHQNQHGRNVRASGTPSRWEDGECERIIC